MTKLLLGTTLPVFVDALTAACIGYVLVYVASIVCLQLPEPSHPGQVVPDPTHAAGDERVSPDCRTSVSIPQAIPHERSRVAVIVPYRNRSLQLVQFTSSIDSFLSRQNVDFSVFVVEQLGSAEFNRGALLNVGFLEAREHANATQRQFDCIVIHDIDLLPVDGRNSYDCLKNAHQKAVQLSTAIDLYSWGLPDEADGGVTLLRTDAFRRTNGYSNRFYGWGGEDNDFKSRLRVWDIAMCGASEFVGRYVTLKEGHYRSGKTAEGRFKLLGLSARLLHEGLGTVKYRLVGCTVRPLYTLVSVDLWMHEDAELVKRKGMSLSGSLEALVSLARSGPGPAA